VSSQDGGSAARRPAALPGEKYDLELLMKIVEEERAYDESVKVRVTQEDIRKLIEKKRKKRK
jgi:hypothetical protein